MDRDVVITGIGLVSPLGERPAEALGRVRSGRTAGAAPSGFDPTPFDCRLCAEAAGFDAEPVFPGNKALRLMNRDAQMAAVAARRAVTDAGLTVGRDYAPEQIALYGATGLAGLPIGEVARLAEGSAGAGGRLDLRRFGDVALKRVRPVLSFKILSNMPICFVSILEGLRGPNAVYTPWEGQGARAIAAGARGVRRGRVPCAVVGGCDVKTHAFAFITLQQQGLFASWRATGAGTVPGEGATFLVLEDAAAARARKAHVYARLAGWTVRTVADADRALAQAEALASLPAGPPQLLMASADGDAGEQRDEDAALARVGLGDCPRLHPKALGGNAFAAAAATQVALAAAYVAADGPGARVWANCSGHGSEVGAFALEAP